MILSALRPRLVIPRGLSTLTRCSLTTMAQDKPYHEKPLIRDCCNHKGSCTLFRPYLTIAARISSSFVRVSTRQLAGKSLSKGISSTLNFHESISTDGTRNSQPLTPKANAISTELTWLLDKACVTNLLFFIRSQAGNDFNVILYVCSDVSANTKSYILSWHSPS